MRLLLVIVLLISILVSGITVNAANEVSIPHDDPHIRYIGRWIDDGNGCMKGTFEGEIVIKFRGTDIRASKKSSGGVYIRLDDGEYEYADLGSTKLCKNLENTEHTLRIFSQAQLAFPTVTGFTLTNGGEFLEPDNNKVIEFIGDSILEGYVKPGQNSSVISYGTHTARALGYERNIVAFGGITVSANYGNPDKLGMPARYYLSKEYVANETPPAWDTEKFVPDIIVINLGANDSGVPDPIFILSYEAFLRKLRDSYPDTLIFAMTVLHDRKTQQVKEAYEKAKDEKMFLVDTSTWGTLDTADGLHITAEAHELVGEKLADFIKTTLEEQNKPKETLPSPEAEADADGTENVSTSQAPVDVPDEVKTDEENVGGQEKTSGKGLSATVIAVIAICAVLLTVGGAAFVIKKKKK